MKFIVYLSSFVANILFDLVLDALQVETLSLAQSDDDVGHVTADEQNEDARGGGDHPDDQRNVENRFGKK